MLVIGGKPVYIKKHDSMVLMLKWEIISLSDIIEEYTWTTIVGKIVGCVL